MSLRPTCGPGQYADRLGITLDGLRQAARRIPLPWQPGEKYVDIEANDAAWAAAYRRGQVHTPPPKDARTSVSKNETRVEEDDEDLDDFTEPEPTGLEAAKLRKEQAQARNWELRNEALERKLLPLAEVEATWEGIAGAIDAAFGALPEKLASRLDGDPREIKRIAREVIREIRDELSDRVEQVAVEVEQASGSVAGQLDAMDGASTAPAPAAPTPKKRGRPPKVKPT